MQIIGLVYIVHLILLSIWVLINNFLLNDLNFGDTCNTYLRYVYLINYFDALY